jgi:hypothetical protein
MDRWAEPPISPRGAKMRSQDDGVHLFFFLIGLALLMVWLTQQLYL